MSEDHTLAVTQNDLPAMPLVDLKLYFQSPSKWMEEQKRQFAHYFWEQGGRQDGQDEENWQKACDAYNTIFGNQAAVNWDGIVQMVEKVLDDIEELRRDREQDKSVKSLLIMLTVLKLRCEHIGQAVGSVIEAFRESQFRV